MAIPFSNTHLRVPTGFRDLLEGLAREVLRAQPRDIVAFAAEHFQALLDERERSGTDPAAWGSRLEDLYYNEPQEPPDKDEEEEEDKDEVTRRHRAAVTIQAAYRGFRVRREAKRLREALSQESWA